MTIKIGFTGDFCPWKRIQDAYHAQSWQMIFNNIKSFFDDNELNIINLECPLIRDGTPILKSGPHLKADPETSEILRYINCYLVATANNHLMDYNIEGLNSTYDALSRYGIKWVGSGYNLKDASSIYYSTIYSTRFAFINIAENEWSVTHDNYPGVNPLDPVAVFNQISEARSNADFVIVIAHGGHEHYNLPSPRMKKLYRFFVDSGAHAVISHHTHVISGFEIYKKAPVFYGLGNFCFDWKNFNHKEWNTGMLVKLEFSIAQPVAFQLCFISQNNQEPIINFLSENEKALKMRELEVLNRVIADDGALEESFENYASGLKELMLTLIEPYSGKYLLGLKKKKILPSLLTASKKRLLTNLIRCESHRDILLSALQ